MSKFEDFVVQSATSYLQSIVFVDDNIYDSDTGKPMESVSLGGVGSPLVSQFSDDNAALEDETDETEPTPEEDAEEEAEEEFEVDPYHPRKLMESFAQSGIVCALYEPQPNFSVEIDSELFCLCERADVVILDWDLYGDDGDNVSNLLAHLIEKSEAALPHHVRLCAIYTNRPSLHPVLDSLLEKLTSKGCSVGVEIEGKLRLISGATRISVFGKPVSVGSPPDDKEYEVSESDLAGRIINEFASLHRGLMPAFALHGLAAVRRNTKRLLDKFRAELDGAFLLHRALVLNDGDAFDELPELLSDEIRAVVEDSWPTDVPLNDIVGKLIGEIPINDPSKKWTTVKGQPYDSKALLADLLAKGDAALAAEIKKSSQLKDLKKGQGFRGIKPSLLIDFEKMLEVEGDAWSESLAALFCNRTHYGIDGLKLGFGTVVRHRLGEDKPWDFSICLMPICDSQRLKKNTQFPFWRLKPNAKCGQAAKRFGIVVVDREGKSHCLASGGKIRDMLWMLDFDPDDTGWVVADIEKYSFKVSSATDMCVEWVAELKPLHAQRIAAYLGSEASRVGLVESEWLRLFCDR